MKLLKNTAAFLAPWYKINFYLKNIEFPFLSYLTQFITLKTSMDGGFGLTSLSSTPSSSSSSSSSKLSYSPSWFNLSFQGRGWGAGSYFCWWRRCQGVGSSIETLAGCQYKHWLRKYQNDIRILWNIWFSRAYAGPELVRAPDSRQGGLRKYEETPRGEILAFGCRWDIGTCGGCP